MNAIDAAEQAVMVRTWFEVLAEAGVRHLFVAPGSRSTPLVQAAHEMAQRKPVPWQVWPVLDERAAAFAALGASREGQLAAVICTSGSAVAHLLPATIEAERSGHCVVLLTADRPHGAWQLGAPQSVHQEPILKSHANFAPVALQPSFNRRANAARTLRQAVAEGRPLHVNFHLDTPLTLANDMPKRVKSVSTQRPQVQDEEALPPPKRGERALVVVGALSPDQPKLLAHTMAAAGVQWQVLAEACSNLRGYLPATAPIRYEAWLRQPAVRAAIRPDSVVRFGAWPVSKGLQLLLEECAAADVPHTYIGGAHPSNPLGQSSLRWLRSSPAAALANWDETVVDTETTEWLRRMAAEDSDANWRLDDLLASPEATANEPGIIHAFLSALPDQTPVQIANSMPIRHLEAFWPAQCGAVMGFSRGANGIDGTLATAWGRALALERPSWVVLGDAALLHDATSLQLLRVRPDLRVLCFDNDGGAIFDWLPAAKVVGPAVHRDYFTQPHGLDLVAVARAFGLTAEVVQGPKAAALIAGWAREDCGPQVVVAKTDAVAARAAWRDWTGQ